jgi:hypothetical protein
MSNNKFSEGERFEDEDGVFEISVVAEDHDPFDYYVDYSVNGNRRKPDHIGKSEADIESADRV